MSQWGWSVLIEYLHLQFICAAKILKLFISVSVHGDEVKKSQKVTAIY